LVTRLPIPPIEFRRIVGPTDEALFDNPTGRPVFSDVHEAAYSTVLDFGCGCGRLARQMIQQHPRPQKYLGIDRHKGMVEWCQANLTTNAPEFTFQHHDVFHPVLNPEGTPGHLPFPADDQEVMLFIAYSVFTHLLEPDAEFYLHELARILNGGGVAITTWFVFDKKDFPMMQEFQNALYINAVDPTNAVIFDQEWLSERVADAGLMMTRITPPSIRGFQWTIRLERRQEGRQAAVFTDDLAPRGLARPPIG
jgi:SAM-dependent methyltransferase